MEVLLLMWQSMHQRTGVGIGLLGYKLQQRLDCSFLCLSLWVQEWPYLKSNLQNGDGACRFGFQFLAIGDAIAPVIPVALGWGRVGNFINGELWGKITTVPWGMYFYHIDIYPRHPWPIYAILLEGFLLTTILWWYARKPRPLGSNMACFLMGYGSIRIFEEFFREPDVQYGYLWGDWLTMGQVLCLPMMLLALYLWFGLRLREKA